MDSLNNNKGRPCRSAALVSQAMCEAQQEYEERAELPIQLLQSQQLLGPSGTKKKLSKKLQRLMPELTELHDESMHRIAECALDTAGPPPGCVEETLSPVVPSIHLHQMIYPGTDPNEHRIATSLDHLLQGVKRDYMDFIQRLTTQPYRDRVKRQISSEADHNQRLISKKLHLEQEIDKLTKDGVRLLEKEIKKLESDAETPMDLISTGREIVSQHTKLDRKAKSLEKEIKALEEEQDFILKRKEDELLQDLSNRFVEYSLPDLRYLVRREINAVLACPPVIYYSTSQASKSIIAQNPPSVPADVILEKVFNRDDIHRSARRYNTEDVTIFDRFSDSAEDFGGTANLGNNNHPFKGGHTSASRTGVELIPCDDYHDTSTDIRHTERRRETNNGDNYSNQQFFASVGTNNTSSQLTVETWRQNSSNPPIDWGRRSAGGDSMYERSLTTSLHDVRYPKEYTSKTASPNRQPKHLNQVQRHSSIDDQLSSFGVKNNHSRNSSTEDVRPRSQPQLRGWNCIEQMQQHQHTDGIDPWPMEEVQAERQTSSKSADLKLTYKQSDSFEDESRDPMSRMSDIIEKSLRAATEDGSKYVPPAAENSGHRDDQTRPISPSRESHQLVRQEGAKPFNERSPLASQSIQDGDGAEHSRKEAISISHRDAISKGHHYTTDTVTTTTTSTILNNMTGPASKLITTTNNNTPSPPPSRMKSSNAAPFLSRGGIKEAWVTATALQSNNVQHQQRPASTGSKRSLHTPPDVILQDYETPAPPFKIKREDSRTPHDQSTSELHHRSSQDRPITELLHSSSSHDRPITELHAQIQLVNTSEVFRSDDINGKESEGGEDGVMGHAWVGRPSSGDSYKQRVPTDLAEAAQDLSRSRPERRSLQEENSSDFDRLVELAAEVDKRSQEKRSLQAEHLDDNWLENDRKQQTVANHSKLPPATHAHWLSKQPTVNKSATALAPHNDNLYNSGPMLEQRSVYGESIAALQEQHQQIQHHQQTGNTEHNTLWPMTGANQSEEGKSGWSYSENSSPSIRDHNNPTNYASNITNRWTDLTASSNGLIHMTAESGGLSGSSQHHLQSTLSLVSHGSSSHHSHSDDDNSSQVSGSAASSQPDTAGGGGGGRPGSASSSSRVFASDSSGRVKGSMEKMADRHFKKKYFEQMRAQQID